MLTGLCLRFLLLQQLHHEPSKQNFDDLTGAVTKSASKRAIMMLLDIFVLALEYIKKVRIVGPPVSSGCIENESGAYPLRISPFV